MIVLILVLGAALVVAGLISGWRGEGGVMTDACSVIGGAMIGFALVRLLL